jgi:hypothetical protein
MKRSMNLWTLVLPVAASFASPDNAAGQEPHFTFTVPVEAVSMLPEVSAVRVVCRVFTDATAPGFGTAGPGLIGSNSVDTPVSAGQDFVSDVTVTVNVDPDRNPWDAKSYDCVLYLLKGTIQTLAGWGSYPWSQNKDGSEYGVDAKGTLP